MAHGLPAYHKLELSVISDDLNETRKIVALKEKELSDMRSEISVLDSAENGKGDTSKELAAKLEASEAENQVLRTKLGDQISLTKKAEVAFETQEKLTLSKCELIENLKIIITQRIMTPSCLFTKKQEQ